MEDKLPNAGVLEPDTEQSFSDSRGSRIDRLENARDIENLSLVPRSPRETEAAKMPVPMPDPPQPQNMAEGKGSSIHRLEHAEFIERLPSVPRSASQPQEAEMPSQMPDPPRPQCSVEGKGSRIDCLEYAIDIENLPFVPRSTREPEVAEIPSPMPDPPKPQNTVEGHGTSSRPRRSKRATSAPVDAYQASLRAEEEQLRAAAIKSKARTAVAGNSNASRGKPRAVTTVAGNGREEGQEEKVKFIYFWKSKGTYRIMRRFGGIRTWFGDFETLELAKIGLAIAKPIMENYAGKSEEKFKKEVAEAREAALAAAERYKEAHPEKFVSLPKKAKKRTAQKRVRPDSDSSVEGTKQTRRRTAAPEAEGGGRTLRRITSNNRKTSVSPSQHRTALSRRRKGGASSLAHQDAVSVSGGSHPRDEDPRLPAKRRTLDISHFTADLLAPENSETYVEETAWRFHNPPLPPDQSDFDQLELTPLPPPPGLPEFPNTGHCEWKFHEDSRVLHGNFRNKDSGAVVVSEKDEMFLLSMMERDDISVISEGLADDLNPDLWNPHHLGNIAGRQFYHKFRKFERKEDCSSVEYNEVDKCVSMKVADYVRYLDARHDALSKHDIMTYKRDERTSGDTDFTFYDSDRRENFIDVIDTVLYMIDFDIIKLLPSSYKNFASKFKLPGILPGGKDCMMNAVNENGHPFMGPNLYVTPPASFTHFHQDGHGTVDSGHQCLSGYNEVVMLRRLPESHKKYALYLLNGSGKNGTGQYDALYGLPHGDGVGEKPIWPECDSIERCRNMGYCPSVFILKPGQLVHINKGRLHAFRKMAPLPLPEKDCHAKLRVSILHDLGGAYKEEICVSVAWDWMYRGVSSEGINREIVSMLECAALNRNNLSKETLAIPEHSILQMAQQWSAAMEVTESSWMQFSKSARRSDTHAFPSPCTILKGILPSLRYVVGKHAEAESIAMAQTNPRSRTDRVSIAKKPNSWENPDAFALDPYGNGDFFCRLCQKELSNVYMHCDGCEKILHKDYNICVDCHTEERYKRFDQMHPLNSRKHSTTNHTGNYHFDRRSRCPCKNGPCCSNCGYCAGCSCRCHKWFTLNYRFTTIAEEKKLLEKVEAKVGDFPAHETTARLGWIGSWNGRATVGSPSLGNEDTDSSGLSTHELAAWNESSTASESAEDTDSSASSEKRLSASNESIASESAEDTDSSASSDNELPAANRLITSGAADEAAAARTLHEVSACKEYAQGPHYQIVLEGQASTNELAAANESSIASESAEDTDSSASSEKKLAASNESIASSEPAEDPDLSASSDNKFAAANQSITAGSVEAAVAARTEDEMLACEGHTQTRHSQIVLEDQTDVHSAPLVPREESSTSAPDSSLPSAQRVDECIVADHSSIQQEVEDTAADASIQIDKQQGDRCVIMTTNSGDEATVQHRENLSILQTFAPL